MIIKFEYYWKCIRIYEKAHLISDFRKKYLLSWGSNPRNETKPEEIYDNERVCLRKIVLSFLLDFNASNSLTKFQYIWKNAISGNGNDEKLVKSHQWNFFLAVFSHLWFEASVLSTNYVEPNGARRETEINDLLIPLGTKPTNADLTVAHRWV